ncbi:MAG: hypothetical protein ACR652_07685 [Methylocystis sp.]|uniref:hypothetical protein n=1 Tax=Methylocystis sp. TaxID=1911079 RepID=UPI003DA2C503
MMHAAPPSRSFVELPRDARRRIEALVETLIDLLDQLDGDADLEDGADEELGPPSGDRNPTRIY